MRIRLSQFSISLLIISACCLCACEGEQASPENNDKDRIRPAKLITIDETSNNSYLNYPAVIESQQLSSLSFEVAGVLKELLVVEAQRVEKGDVLAKLDQRDLQAKLSSAQAQYDNASTDYQRAVRLMKEDAIARSTLEQRKSQRDVTKAELETAQKALQDSILIAPYSGNVSKVSVKEKQAVQAGKAAISILGNGGLAAKMNLPSSIIAMSGDQKRNKVIGYLILDVAPTLKIPAQFKEASLEADANSQTYEVSFTFDAPEHINILPGMNATLWFKEPNQFGKAVVGVKVPLTAITTDGEHKYVWVVDLKSMVVSRRNITLQEGVGAELTVLKGLEMGETIVAAGVSYLSEGMIVRPWSQ